MEPQEGGILPFHWIAPDLEGGGTDLPFHWIKIDAVSPNPGPVTKKHVKEIVVKKLGGELRAFLLDGEHKYAYVLAKDIDHPELIEKYLHPREVLELHACERHEGEETHDKT
jgi:hypothetical protein